MNCNFHQKQSVEDQISDLRYDMENLRDDLETEIEAIKNIIKGMDRL